MYQGRCVFLAILSAHNVLAHVLVIFKAENRRGRRIAGIDLTASCVVLRRADISAGDVGKFKCSHTRPRGGCHVGSPCPAIVLACAEAPGLRRTDRCEKSIISSREMQRSRDSADDHGGRVGLPRNRSYLRACRPGEEKTGYGSVRKSWFVWLRLGG